ncbi:hypothetical protein Tco_1134788 [Tanacetum coccineum]
MAQPQRQADVHQDELCPPNKSYALMDANKKIDLYNPLCPNERKLLANILQNYPLRFSIATSSSVPWIYLGQFCHTLKEDGSKYKLSFVLDRKRLTMTLDDFRIIFHLPQATDNNHDRFVPAPKFSEMVPFYINNLGFTMMYCFVNNVHVDYADLLWEGFHYSLEHPTTLIPNPRFTKLIVSHYMTAFLEISRRARDKYHNLEDDEMVKIIFNSGKNKAGVGIKIPSCMITDEMKLTENYRLYAAVFGVDVLTTQSQSIESTHRTHRITSAPRTPNVTAVFPCAIKCQNNAYRHPDGQENIVDDSLIPRNDESNIPDTRIEPKSNKESPELQGRYGYLFAHLRARFMPRKSFDTLADNLHDVMVETLPAMVDKHIKEQVMKQVPEQVRNQVPVYVAEGLILERQKAKEETERLIAKAILQERGNIQAQISTQIENAIANVIPSQVDASVRSYMSGHILHVHPAQSQTSSVPEQQYQLNTVPQTACRTPAVRPRDQDDPHDDAHPEGENSAKRQKTSEYEAYVSGESSSGQVFQEEQAPINFEIKSK